MYFMFNYDENLWVGIEFVCMGDGYKVFVVLVVIFDGMFLLYIGMEVVMDK